LLGIDKKAISPKRPKGGKGQAEGGRPLPLKGKGGTEIRSKQRSKCGHDILLKGRRYRWNRSVSQEAAMKSATPLLDKKRGN